MECYPLQKPVHSYKYAKKKIWDKSLLWNKENLWKKITTFTI